MMHPKRSPIRMILDSHLLHTALINKTNNVIYIIYHSLCPKIYIYIYTHTLTL